MSRHAPRRAAMAALLLLALLPAACASRGAPAPGMQHAAADPDDPLEGLNRVSLGVTYAVDTLVLRPAAEAYQALVAPEIRAGIRNALGNLRSPVLLANNLLQGDLDQAGVTIGRFVVNSTLGLAGTIDVAARLGLPGRAEDFGQTLALWGAGDGPYLFLPLLGPSNPRDLLGFGVDIATDPTTWIGGAAWVAAARVRGALVVLDTREALIEPVDMMMAETPDPYVTIRTAYRARRAAAIAGHGAAPPAAPGTGFGAGMGMTAGEMMDHAPGGR